MANLYVKASGSNTSPYDTWAKAATSLVTATALASAGDNIFVDSAFNETLAGATSVTYTVAAGVHIYSTNDTTNAPPTTYAAGATINTQTSGAITVNGGAWFGYRFNNGTSSNSTTLTIASTNNVATSFEDCNFSIGSTNAANVIQLQASSGTASDTALRTRNCSFKFKATGQGFSVRGKWRDEGSNLCDSAGSLPSTLFKLFGAGASPEFIGSDLSGAGNNTLFGEGTAWYVATLVNCKLPSSAAILATLSVDESGEVYLYDCSGGDHDYKFYHANYRGNTLVEPTKYVTADGATYDGTNRFSWTVVCNHGSFGLPYYTPWIDRFNASLTTQTPYFEIAREDSTSALNDDQVWAEFMVKSSSGSTIANIATDQKVPLATAAAQANGTGTGNWTGLSGSLKSMKCDAGGSVTFAEIGTIRGRIALVSSAGQIIQVDPKIRGLATDSNLERVNGAAFVNSLLPASVSITPSVGALTLAGVAATRIRGTIISPSVGTLTLTGAAPTEIRGTIIKPSVGALALAGVAPTLIRGSILRPVAGALVLAGLAPTIARSITRQPSVGALTLTGAAPTVIRGSVLTPVAGALALAGIAPTVIRGTVIAPSVGSLLLSGQTPTLARSTTIAPTAGALSLSGKQATVTSTDAHTIAPTAGALVIAGLQPNIAAGNNVIRIPTTGALLLSGVAPIVNFTDAHTAQPSAGALTLSGQAPILARSTTIVPTVGALTLSGKQATVSYTDAHTITPAVAALIIDGLQPNIQAGANVVRTPSAGALVLGGVAPIISATDFEMVQPSAGVLSLDGQQPTISTSDHHTFVPNAAALLLSGVAPIIVQTDAHTITVSPGALVLAGQAAFVSQGNILSTNPGALVIVGSSPILRTQNVIVPATGALQFVGSAAELIESGNIIIHPATAALLLVGRKPILNGVGAGDIKTIYGVDIGDVSSINETAKVDVKTFLGLTP